MSNKKISVRDNVALERVLTTNATTTSFTAPTATTTRPTVGPTTGYVNLRREGVIPEWLFLMPFGTGDNNDVFEMWVTGWRRTGSGLYMPFRLVKLTCTLSAFVGVDGEDLDDGEKACDTVTATEGISNVSYELYSTEDDTPAHVLLKANGCDMVQFTFDMTTGDPTGANCLYARV